MTNEQRNMAQDLLDGLLRDEYVRGFADATNDQKDIGELEEQNAEMLRLFKLLLPEMDAVDKMCEIAGRHPFTGMRGAIELGITKGEGR